MQAQVNGLDATSLKFTYDKKIIKPLLDQQKTLDKHGIRYDETSEDILLKPNNLVKSLYQVLKQNLSLHAFHVEAMII